MSHISAYFDALAPDWDTLKLPTRSNHHESIVRSLPLKEGDKVLDVACGTGVITLLLAERVHRPVLGIDVSPNMIAQAKEKYRGNDLVSFETQDFYSFEGCDYDAIVLFDAYPHFLDAKALGKAAAHALKKNGIWCILHDIGRKELELFPAHQDPKLSRDLASPQEEALLYRDDFDVLEAKDDLHSYRLILQKK